MNARLAMRMGRATLGLAGAGALVACSAPSDEPSGETLGECYRSIQHAQLAKEVADKEQITPNEKSIMRALLSNAESRVLSVWAQREGLEIPPSDFENETRAARNFRRGINLEAGLSPQDRLTALSNTADAPDAWRALVDTALNCADEIAP